MFGFGLQEALLGFIVLMLIFGLIVWAIRR